MYKILLELLANDYIKMNVTVTKECVHSPDHTCDSGLESSDILILLSPSYVFNVGYLVENKCFDILGLVTENKMLKFEAGY